MTPKEKRERLFKVDRPNIREMQLFNDNHIGKDMSVLWAAHKLGTFDLPDTTQEEFAEIILSEVDPYERKWIVEDKNNKYSSGYGAVGMIYAAYNGWELEPHIEIFNWATKRNILRLAVSFFQMIRYDKQVGIVNVYSLDETKKLFNHLIKYGVLNYAAKIPKGDPKGDRHIYYVKGKKNG